MPGCRAAYASQRKKKGPNIPQKGTIASSRAKATSKAKKTCSARKENGKESGEGSVKFPTQAGQQRSARKQTVRGNRDERRGRKKEKEERV